MCLNSSENQEARWFCLNSSENHEARWFCLKSSENHKARWFCLNSSENQEARWFCLNSSENHEARWFCLNSSENQTNKHSSLQSTTNAKCILLLGGHMCHNPSNGLQILPLTIAIFDYAIGLKKLSANRVFGQCSNGSKFVTDISDYISNLFYNHPCCLRQHI